MPCRCDRQHTDDPAVVAARHQVVCMAKSGGRYASKTQLHDAIISASDAVSMFLWHGENITSNLQMVFAEGEPESQSLPTIVAVYEIMKDEYEKAVQMVAKVNEWLNRAHLSIVLDRGQRPEIELAPDFFTNYHAACLVEMHYLLMDIEECASIRWPTAENLTGNIAMLSRWTKTMPSSAVSLRIALVQIERDKAIEIWEQSPRTDVDEELLIKPVKLERNLSNKDAELLKTLNENGMDYDAAQQHDGRNIEAVRQAVRRARRDCPNLISSKYPNVNRDNRDNHAVVTNGKAKKQARSVM
jgi:hypothetical protein